MAVVACSIMFIDSTRDRQWPPAGSIEHLLFCLPRTEIFYMVVNLGWLCWKYVSQPVSTCGQLQSSNPNYVRQIWIVFVFPPPATDLSYMYIFLQLNINYYIWRKKLQLTYHICTIVSKGPTRCNVAHARILHAGIQGKDLHGGWPAQNGIQLLYWE